MGGGGVCFLEGWRNLQKHSLLRYPLGCKEKGRLNPEIIAAKPFCDWILLGDNVCSADFLFQNFCIFIVFWGFFLPLVS